MLLTESRLKHTKMQIDWRGLTCIRHDFVVNWGKDMIIISREKNESIMINDDIRIVVVEIRGDKVRLGVELPSDATLHRSEVYEAIRRIDESRPSTPQTDSADPI